MYQTILIASDGTPAAGTTVAHGISLADEFGASLVALYVIEILPSGFPSQSLHSIAQVDELRRDGADIVNRISAKAAKTGIRCETSVRNGSVPEEIVACASKADVDAIVMGTSRRRRIGNRFLGQTTEQVVRTANVPVLVVPHATE